MTFNNIHKLMSKRKILWGISITFRTKTLHSIDHEKKGCSFLSFLFTSERVQYLLWWKPAKEYVKNQQFSGKYWEILINPASVSMPNTFLICAATVRKKKRAHISLILCCCCCCFCFCYCCCCWWCFFNVVVFNVVIFNVTTPIHLHSEPKHHPTSGISISPLSPSQST